ncbi:spermatogenesis-associated protein 31A6-like [Trichechus manatus latirostris]|uniref:Spermatogenesis-associated protein 31A6-like n=1 Tax=Trichechus manatus latirostris TaxID=127582 RepID=A0A2Y9DZE1_TRIMA|nr:spermatogenesis-associated protein 31A6-like [Trichechus manatus latirostris]
MQAWIYRPEHAQDAQLPKSHSAIQIMENYLCPLKSISATLLSSSSTSWAIETILGFLCGVGLFFLLLPYLQSNPPLPPPEKNINIKKPQVETRRRNRKNKSETVKACRNCLKKLHEARGLIALLQTLLGKLTDKGHFRQRKFGEPSGPVRKGAPAEARRRPCAEQCAEPVEDAASVVSPSAAIGPPTQPPRHLASTASAKPPEDPSDLKTKDSSSWITEDPSDWTTDDSCDWKTAPESSSSGNSYYLASSVPKITCPDCSSRPISALSWWWAAAKALFFPTWKHCESQQEHTSHHPSKASFWGSCTNRSVEAGGPSSLNPDVQKLLEIEIAKRVQLKIWKEKEKDGLFKKHMNPDYHLNSLGMLKSFSHEQTTTVPQPFWSKPEQLSSPQQLIYPKVLGNHLQQKCNQLFWGLPSLHSESLVATAWVSGSSSPLQSPSVLFNRISNACPVQVSSLPSQPQPLPHPEAQPQAPPLAPVLPQACLLSSFPIPPPASMAQIRAYGISCPSAQNETQSLISTEIQHLESPLLQKQLKSGWAVPSVAKGSQEAFSPLSPNLPQDSRASEAYKSDSILPGDVPSRTELRKQLEQHIRKRLTQHKRSLPSRIQESLELTQPQGKLRGTGQAKDQHGPSWHSVFIGESSKDVKKMGSRHQESCHVKSPRNFQLGKDLCKGLGQVPKYDISQGSEKSPVKVLQTGSEKELKSDSMSNSGSNTGNYILRNPDKKQLENTLKAHLGRELGQIIKGKIPVGVGRSWLTANHTLPKSNTQIETGNLVTSKCQAYCTNTTQEFSFLPLGTRQALEAHIKRFLVRHKWDLPVQVGEPMNLTLSETQSSPLSQYEFPSSATYESWTSSRAEAAKIWGENPKAGWGEKATPKKSEPTLENPLLAPSPVGEEVQGALRQTPPDNDPRPSEPTQSGQEGRQCFQPLTPSIVGRARESRTVLGAQRGSLEPTPSQSVTWKEPRKEGKSCALGGPSCSVARLEMSYQSQSSRAKETRETVVAKGSSAPQLQERDILKTSMLAKSQNINVDLRGLGAPGTSKSPSPPRMSVQDPGKTYLKAQVLSEELKMELETANQPQSCPVDELLQDCATEMILQGCATDVLLASDILASQASRSHLKRVSNRDMPSKMLSELMAAGGSSLVQQDSKIPKLQDPWKSQSKISAPTDERKDFRRRKPKECEEGLAGLGASPASGMSQPAQDKKSVESLGIKSPQLPTEKGHAAPEVHFKKRMSSFLQSICPNKKDKGQGDPLQKGKRTSASAQSHRPVKSRSVFMDRGAAEAQALMTAVGQILVEKLRLQQGFYASKLNQQTEKIQEGQDPAGGRPSYRKAPCYPEHRREMNGTVCHHHATAEGQSSIRNKWTHEGDRNPYIMVKFKISDRALPSRRCSKTRNEEIHTDSSQKDLCRETIHRDLQRPHNDPHRDLQETSQTPIRKLTRRPLTINSDLL